MSYRNPVYTRDFADPFILKFRGSYWAYSTGFQADGRVFGVLHSEDLVHWDYSGGAMDPLPGGHTCYWAPEVTYEDDGTFLMYFSVGNEENMVIRVARADEPSGPFIDLGVQLTKEPFAIDAHVFKDEDGTRYLFYATDFLQHTHIGTGTVVAKMRDALSLEGEAVPVTRAKFDWQVYDPNRESKGGMRWHTVEGPFVLKRKGMYYEMFSGGNWQNITYGVSFATSDSVIRGEEWDQHADGQKNLPILRTHPGRVVGPGHNSVVRGPNNRDLFCVYHEWVNNERVLAIDRLDWRGPDLTLLGPTTETVPGPFMPRKISPESEGVTWTVQLDSPSSLQEFSVYLNEHDALDLGLYGADGALLFRRRLSADTGIPRQAWHRIRLEIDTRLVRLDVGESLSRENATLEATAVLLELASLGAPQLTPLEQTPGWEELFETEQLGLRGWQVTDASAIQIDNKELRVQSGSEAVVITKDLNVAGDFELTVNLRLDGDASSASVVLGQPDQPFSLQVVRDTLGELLRIISGTTSQEYRIEGAAGVYHQIRVLHLAEEGEVSIDGERQGRYHVHAGRQLALRVTGSASLDMVRVTEIASA